MAGVSVRGWLALGLIGSVCIAFLGHVLAAVSVTIHNGDLAALNNEALKLQVAMAERLALVALGYYFGKQELEHFAKRKPEIAP